jgi:soluble cytochrome b562
MISDEPLAITPVEIVDALNKIPTDTDFVEKAITKWERAGDNAQLAATSLIMLHQLADIKTTLAALNNTVQNLNDTIGNPKEVSVVKLTTKFVREPELREGFSIFVDEKDGKQKLQYQGKTDTYIIFEAFDRLHLKLKNYYGLKEITHKTMNNALIKSFNWSKAEAQDWDEATKKTTILQTADLLYLKKKSKKLTIPEIKLALSPLEETTRFIKNTLLDAGWVTLRQGTCNTIFYTHSNGDY